MLSGDCLSVHVLKILMSVCPCAEEPQARLACKYIKDPRLTDEACGEGAHCRGCATVAERAGGGILQPYGGGK